MHLDPEVLFHELKKAVRHGCRASRLMRYAPALVDLIVPDNERSRSERANLAEQALRRACDSYEGDWGDVMECLLGLALGTYGALLKERRRRAAGLIHVATETFRRHYEQDALWDVAFALTVLGQDHFR